MFHIPIDLDTGHRAYTLIVKASIYVNRSTRTRTEVQVAPCTTMPRWASDRRGVSHCSGTRAAEMLSVECWVLLLCMLPFSNAGATSSTYIPTLFSETGASQLGCGDECTGLDCLSRCSVLSGGKCYSKILQDFSRVDYWIVIILFQCMVTWENVLRNIIERAIE